MGYIPMKEEIVPRWGARSSKPGGAVKRSLVGSTPALFRHFRGSLRWFEVPLIDFAYLSIHPLPLVPAPKYRP